MPDPHEELMDGVCWGHSGVFFTPAFWKAFVWKYGTDYEPVRFGTTFAEEVVACILCGYGVPGEVGVAAFEKLRAAGLITQAIDADEVQRALEEPLHVAGRSVRYRFFRQKSRVIAAALKALESGDFTGSHRDVRDALTSIDGVGMKTASYAVRNWYGSDEVAVLDIHIVRACVLIGLFPDSADPSRRYRELEESFLAFAARIDVRPSVLDNAMWHAMRRLGPTVLLG
jgi:thermostable 8-oxoguanine DNA glycosylase